MERGVIQRMILDTGLKCARTRAAALRPLPRLSNRCWSCLILLCSPFDRRPLTVEELVPHGDLRQRIEEWKQSRSS